MNFSDLVGPKAKDRKPQEPPNLRIAEMNVEKVQISYRDEVTGQELNVAELNLKTGRLDGAPVRTFCRCMRWKAHCAPSRDRRWRGYSWRAS